MPNPFSNPANAPPATAMTAPAVNYGIHPELRQVSAEGAIGVMLFLALAAIVGYLVPFWVACLRGHEAKWRILVANIFTAWSGFGWIACLFWALSATDQESYRYNRRHN